MARAWPGDICVVTGGPLGNLLQALRLEPRLPQLLSKVVITGGALAVAGNVSPVAEYNFWQDPHAADEVVTSGLDVTVLGLDASGDANLTPERVLAWAQGQSGLNQRLWAHALCAIEQSGRCSLAAFMALRLLQDPTLFPTETGRLRVITDGLAQGQSILDRSTDHAYPQAGWESTLPEVQMVCGTARPGTLV